MNPTVVNDKGQMIVDGKAVPGLAELRDIVNLLARHWLRSTNMCCEVCHGPATCVTEEVRPDRFCGDALCDTDRGNRKVVEDYRAPNIRRVQEYLKRFDTEAK